MKTYQFDRFAEHYDEDILSRIPELTLATIERYVQRGIPMGDFLQAVVANDLREAIGRADGGNMRALKQIVQVFYNYCPGNCWGTREVYKAWVERGGLAGIRQAELEPVEQTTAA
jgi:hypothetical protein